MKRRLPVRLCALLLVTCLALVTALAAPSPKELWASYDDRKGDLKEEVVDDSVREGIRKRKSYISAYINGEEVRVYCEYSVKVGVEKAPGLLMVHGWMGAPSIDVGYVKDGWAVMAHDYCGKTGERVHHTKYPPRLAHGNMDGKAGERVITTVPGGADITDPTQSSDYLWYAIQRRVLSYLERQPEVDRGRIGAIGYSYGGTLMWNLAIDERVRAVAAYFGIGYNVYYRDKRVWMYDPGAAVPPKSSGEAVFLESLAPEVHVPFIKAATLFLNGSNDHHGGHERGLESFKHFPSGVPWSFAVQARGHHNTERIGQDTKLWLERHVLGREIFWPEQPASQIRLDSQGVPELVVTPASSERVATVECYLAQKSPISFARAWRDVNALREGDRWVAKLPVLNVDDYVFGYANVTYDNTVVRSTGFNAVVPSTLGAAVATDKPSTELGSGEGWSEVAEAEGVRGIRGFRCLNIHRGSRTEKLNDPKWKAPAGKDLSFRFYCTEPQSIQLAAAQQYVVPLDITASDDWQEMVISAERLVHGISGQRLKDWSEVGSLEIKPVKGADLTRVVFADFRWVDRKSAR
jgi:dienelactone hydrolase